MSRFPAIGGGSEKPIADKDRAETFEESDVNLTLSGGTVIKNESVRMYNGETITGTVNDSSTAQESIEISGDFTINAEGFYSENSGVSLQYAEVEGDDVYNQPRDLSQYPDPATVTVRVSNNHFAERYWGLDITTSNMGTVSAYVEWPQPTDIFRWDAATFNATTEGETVDVYIEESTDGGSTWTEISGPISRGQPINAEPDSEVRLRADFQRDDDSNNPRLNSVYRRWVV